MPALTERRPELNLPATPKDWRAEKEASRSLETRKVPDPYWFYFVNKKLMSPFTLDAVGNSIENGSPIGKQEYTAFEKAQRFIDGNDRGFVLWYSPEAKGKYPVPKVIVSEIATIANRKLVFNRAIILDPQKNDALEIASQISGRQFANPEEVREEVFFFNPPEGFHWTRYLEEFMWAPEAFEQVRQGTDVEMKAVAARHVEKILKAETHPTQVWAQMQNAGIVGPHLESCPLKSPLTAIDALLKHSLLAGEKKFVKNCGSCGAVINDYISKGYKCPDCKETYEGC